MYLVQKTYFGLDKEYSWSLYIKRVKKKKRKQKDTKDAKIRGQNVRNHK